MCRARISWNNTVLNLVAKARHPHREEVIALFTDPNVPFSLRAPWCVYLYTHGIIDTSQPPEMEPSEEEPVCKFASPFVQLTLYSART